MPKGLMMKSKVIVLTACTMLIAVAGCSMCCGPYDYSYPTYGGRHERVDRERGRVGSVFSDPSFADYGPSADSNLQPYEDFRQRNQSDFLDESGELPVPGETPLNGPVPDDNTSADRGVGHPLRSPPGNWR